LGNKSSDESMIPYKKYQY